VLSLILKVIGNFLFFSRFIGLLDSIK